MHWELNKTLLCLTGTPEGGCADKIERSEMTIVTSEVLHTGISQIYIFSADHSVKHVDTHAISITNIQHTY